jgi:hypothetical protein
MPSAAALRLEIERTLEHRFPAALTPAPKTVYEVAPTGVGPVDALLEGGLPVGAISEITGLESSGRTSLTLAFLAKRTEASQVCAWVDAGDAFDPEGKTDHLHEIAPRRITAHYKWFISIYRCTGSHKNAPKPNPNSHQNSHQIC